jgi:hypothetical protein
MWRDFLLYLSPSKNKLFSLMYKETSATSCGYRVYHVTIFNYMLDSVYVERNLGKNWKKYILMEKHDSLSQEV